MSFGGLLHGQTQILDVMGVLHARLVVSTARETEFFWMVKFFRGQIPTQTQFESQQDKLRRLSGDVLTRYRKEMAAEISDPDRLAATYGEAFASADARRQAEVVSAMATSLLGAANASVNVLGPNGQETIAASAEGFEAGSHLVLEESFCKNVIGTGRELAISDSSTHSLVCDTELAINGLITSYLGVPVANRDGIIVGVLCVWDSQHRDWGVADVGLLMQLSAVLTRSLV